MEKYRVLTDNLDWYGVSKDTILEEKNNGEYFVNPGYALTKDTMEKLLELHGDWFEKIEEKTYTEQDMRECFNTARRHEIKKVYFGDKVIGHIRTNFEDYLKSKNNG